MEKTVKTEVQTQLSTSIHLRIKLSSSQVCVHPLVVGKFPAIVGLKQF